MSFQNFNFGRKMFDNEIITQNDIRNNLTKKKEKQILEHRKKIMRDLFTKMCNSSKQNLVNNNVNNSKDNMEVEEDINNEKNMNEVENKKKLIEKCLNNAKDLYDKLGEEFIYQIIDDKKISFCPKCAYPVIIVDKNISGENHNEKNVTISCVNSCFQFDINESAFDKYSMDNIMDLYSQALKSDNGCNHNDIAPILSGDDSILFTCITCLFEQFN